MSDVCHRCNGTGLEPDHWQTGKAMRARRKVAGLSLRSVAQGMGISPSYLSDLELGRRAWGKDILHDFCQVVPE